MNLYTISVSSLIFFLFLRNELYAHPNKINSKFANLLRLLCFTAVDELESGKNIDTESVQYFDIGNDVKEEGTCGICLEEKESVTLIPCEHKFCNTCINISLYKYELNKCSVCRQEFTSTEGLIPINITIGDNYLKRINNHNVIPIGTAKKKDPDATMYQLSYLTFYKIKNKVKIRISS
ncbi:uncharacterized protein LOC126896158 isoform X3 [Daktulosphaira vitifoliae]|uniref:uncharacterized protein LOC126896158 isoform X3 n=1 Tax=Daktulosphaira vitifoliae TaxID=58002 RepID=UPI0021A9F4EC|nr:uncharacterized protein LOC126896158 isoform X3 [Daktulosphaira vitifoliae]